MSILYFPWLFYVLALFVSGYCRSVARSFLASTGHTYNDELRIEGIMVAYINYICLESLKVELFVDYNNFDENQIGID